MSKDENLGIILTFNQIFNVLREKATGQEKPENWLPEAVGLGNGGF
jgi:hypothetical protein